MVIMVWAKFGSQTATFYFKIYATCSASKHMLYDKTRDFKSNSHISIKLHKFVGKFVYVVWKNEKVSKSMGMQF